MRLKDTVTIITGGGSGIGRAIACLFAGEGACWVPGSSLMVTGGLFAWRG